MTPQEISKCIETECAYQDARWPKPKHSHSITEYLVYMRHNIEEALKAVSTQNGEQGGAEFLRKVTTLGHACMEEHDIPCRDLTGSLFSALGSRENILLFVDRNPRYRDLVMSRIWGKSTTQGSE